MRQLKINKNITNRENESFDKYLQDIGKVDLITIEMEVELARRIREGDSIALEKLTMANLRFVVSVAKQYQNYGLSLGDLINDGNIGLIKAARRFDETRGFKFISYAVWWIRQSIMQGLADHSRIVRLPLNRIGTLNRLSKLYSSLEQTYQREPSVQEVAIAADLTVQDIVDSQTISMRHISVDAPSDQGENMTLLDILTDTGESPDAGLLLDSLKTEIKIVLNTLTSREAHVISAYYGLDGLPPQTLEEMAHAFNLTRERVRQIKEKATRRLKSTMINSDLRKYLS